MKLPATPETNEQNLSTSQGDQKLRSLFMQAPAAIALLEGPEHIYTFANPLYQKLFSRSGEQLTNRTVKQVFPEVEGQGIYELFDTVFTTGEPFVADEFPASFQENGKVKTGYYNFVLQPIKDEEGLVTGVMIHAYEVTKQVLAHKKIEESEKQLHLITDALPMLISYVDKDRRYRFNNRAYERWFNHSKEDIYGKQVEEVVGKKAYETVKPKIDKVLLGEAVQYETWIPYRNESERFVTVNHIPHFDNNREISGFYTIVNDITGQKEDEEIRSAERLRLYQLFMKAPAIIAVISGADLIVEFANPLYRQLLGADREIDGRPLLEVAPDIEPALLQIVKQVVFEGQRFEAKEMPILLDWDRSEKPYTRFFNLLYEPLLDEQNKPGGLMCFAVEITDQVKIRKCVEESEAKYRSLFEIMDQGFCIVEMIFDESNKPLDYLFLESNPVFEKQTGLSGAIGKTARQLVPDLEDRWFHIYGKVALTGKAANFVEGSEAMGRWFEVYAYRIGGNDSRKVAILFTDISARIKSEAVFKESEQRFRNLADDSPMFVFIIDPDPLAPVSYWNKTWLRYTGQSAEEAAGRAWNGIIHPDDVPVVMDFYVPAFTARQPYFIPAVRTKRHDGEYRWHAYKGNPRYLANGDFNGYVGVGFDVHEQKLAEEALKESEERFRTLADNIQNLAWIANGDGWIFWYNKRWYNYTGTTFEEMQGWGWEKVHHPDHIERVVDFVKKAWKKNEPWELTFPLRNADGEYRWFLTRAYPIPNAEGDVVRWIGTNTDIDDQKTIAEKLEVLVNERTIALQRSNEDLQQFAHVASHDLKEPVRKIRTFGGRLVQEFANDLPEKAKTYVAKIESAADRVYAMINGVLMYASLEGEVVSGERIDLNEIISNIESDLELLIAQKKAVIQYRNLPSIEGSPILIYQLFYNLTNNSLKFSKVGTNPLIEISSGIVQPTDLRKYGLAGREENYVKIIVKDNGIGFSVKDAENIFKTFSRLHPKDQYEGTGLGLALCKKIVERHGGAIAARGLENEGSVFEIILPVEQKGS